MRKQAMSVLMGMRAVLPVFACFMTPALGVWAAGASDFSAADIEFFETSVRPILSENCFECHGPAKHESDLRLDHISTILTGGTRGPALVRGEVSRSRMVEAINYGNADLQMPPPGKLDEKKIATLTEWIERGAPWPSEPVPESRAVVEAFDLEKRRDEHWAWQPIGDPVVPTVRSADWPSSSVDRFILAKLEEEGLSPGPRADRRTMIRRLYFDLVGLPPTPEAVESFVTSRDPDAYSILVDELLASPGFGERWSRHWMDLVRYAETYGHESDYPISHAWRYRDYLIRAFNEDLPYDRLVREHIAGDLLPNPRMHPTDGYNESIIGSGFWYMHQATHAPVDPVQDLADRIDNQVDVMSKAFLGMTVACSRCHEHKFDAISTEDYYSITAFLRGSRMQFAYLDQHGKIADGVEQLTRLREKVGSAYRVAFNALEDKGSRIGDYLLAAQEVMHGAWEPEDGVVHPDIVFEDFEGGDYEAWTREGEAFGATPVVGEGSISEFKGSQLASSRVDGDAPEGKLISRPFVIERGYIKLLVGGGAHKGKTYVRLLVDEENEHAASGRNNNSLRPVVWDVRDLVGKEGRIEVVDEHTSTWGYLLVDQITFSDTPFPQPTQRPAASVAQAENLDAGRLTRWVHALQDSSVRSASHPMYVWARLNEKRYDSESGDFARGRESLIEEAETAWKEAESWADPFVVFDDFNDGVLDGWYSSGQAFGIAPTSPGDWDAGRSLLPMPGVIHSGLLSHKLQGTIRSETFKLTHDNIHFRFAGDKGRIKLIIERFALREYNGILFESTLVDVNTGGRFVWHNMTNNLKKFRGLNAYIEIMDDGDGWIAVDEIRFSNDVPAPEDSSRIAKALLTQDEVETTSPEMLARAYANVVEEALVDWAEETQNPLGISLARWTLRHDLIDLGEASDATSDDRSRMDEIVADMPDPIRVLAMTDGTREGASVFLRGNHKTPGDAVVARFLRAVDDDYVPEFKEGSGRLNLAERILDPSNPLTSRVIVNRVWHYLFGRGIVPSVDNFGVLGERPTHPELLDHLATKFREDGQSIKGLIRELAHTSTYRMSSVPVSQEAELRDPDNSLLHRMRVRRLEGEMIRDTVLAVAGSLDREMYGPSVAIYLSPFMGGHRGPSTSGPLDGDLRRTVYVEVRRNYLSPMMLAFDTPLPASTVGRRTESNVPAQALILLNDPFIVEQAKAWGKRVAEAERSELERVTQIYHEALGRAPRTQEVEESLRFLEIQAKAYGLSAEEWTADERVWSDLCHVMFTLKEFIFIG